MKGPPSINVRKDILLQVPPERVIPLISSDRLQGRVSCQTGGSLDYGRGKYAGTTGHNRFEEKYAKIL